MYVNSVNSVSSAALSRNTHRHTRVNSDCVLTSQFTKNSEKRQRKFGPESMKVEGLWKLRRPFVSESHALHHCRTRRAAPTGAVHKTLRPDGESMVLPIESYIDACARHNESPLEPISTALSREASGGLHIANLKLVHTQTHPHAMPSRSLTRRALRSRTPARCVSAPPSRTLPASLRSPSVT